MLRTFLGMALAAAFALMQTTAVLAAGDTPPLPPAIGPETPKVEPVKGDDGLYHQKWFNQSFLDLREDYEEAKAEGKRFAVVFEQRGCVYCVKMHTQVLAKKYINDYVRENFRIVQLNLWGDRKVTDFDGTMMPEKELAQRWKVIFTPWIVFFKDDLSAVEAKWGQELEVFRMGLGMGPGTFYDMFTWIRVKGYEKDPQFQRFHIQRLNEREAIARAKAGGKGQKVN